jgi:predicted Rossmann fold flavoprotein
MQNQETFDVVVIGGGASGMMAAGRAAELGKRVLLLEKNKKLGEKLKISGGGRCNITNAEYDERSFLKHYGKTEQFLYSAFSQFGVKDTFSFFEKRGLPLVVQARKRAFPHTEKAFDVFATLEKYIRAGKVTVQNDSPVTDIRIVNKKIVSVFSGKKEYKGSSFILATGGVSHPETGSTGDGFGWLKKFGHSVSDPTPTIVPLAVSDAWIKELAGVSLSFMKITFFMEGNASDGTQRKKAFSKKGKVLFTHFGLSGPLILNSASAVADLLHSGAVTATIDAFPDTDLGALEKKIISVFDKNKNKMLKNVFGDIAPHGTPMAILSLLKDTLSPDTKVHSVTKEQRKLIVNLLKALPVTIVGLMGYDRAVVADGGVTLSEIDTKTMRSKKIENLFITGDLLHINRPSGGYSLQLCWTTGYVAGSNA